MKFGEYNWKEIKELYESGLTLSDLRQRTGADKKTLSRGLKLAGAELRPPGHRVGMPAPWNSGSKENRYRECAICGNTKHRIVVAEPPTCRSCWSSARRYTTEGKDKYLQKTYGISLEEATAVLSKQDGKCPVCGNSIELFAKMWMGGAAVDHDHSTGKIRGILCHGCNVAIGLLKDNENALSNAQGYLSRAKSAGISSTVSLFYPVIILKPEQVVVDEFSRIDSFTKIEGGEGVTIGRFCHVASYCHLNIGGGQLVMEDGTSAGSGSRIITGSNVPGPGRGCSAIDPAAVITRSKVVIKKNAVLFAGATVLPGVTIGEGAIIAAGAVVRCDVPPGELWGGVPARKLRDAVAVTQHPQYDRHELFIECMAEFYGWDR